MDICHPEMKSEDIGQEFVQHFYSILDNPANRQNIVNYYSSSDSLMTFEGQEIQGLSQILEKVGSLGLQTISRVIDTVDSQPTLDGGVLISVLGRLQCDDGPKHEFSQLFLLKPKNDYSFFVAHDIFRLIGDEPKEADRYMSVN